MIRAIRSHVTGGPDSVVLENLPIPEPGPDDVRIAVKAAGVNFPDVLLIQDLYQMRPPRPFIPGSEIAGVVESVGANVRDLVPGDRVIGMQAWGGFAEKVILPASACFHMPTGTDFDSAAALLVTYATSHYALVNRAKMKPGEKILVLGGAGGVGIAAVELGKAYGGYVVAAVSSEAKAEAAREAGADATVIYPSGPLDRDQSRALATAFKQACGGAVDIVIDPVGGAYAEPAIRALGWEGRHLVIGFTAGIPSIPLNLTLLKGTQIMGVFYGEFCAREPELRKAYLDEIGQLFAEGKVRPRISMRVPLERAAEALQAMHDRIVTGKVIITME